MLESREIVVALILMAVCWFAWYVARERFYLENQQIAELACYSALFGLAVIGSSILIMRALLGPAPGARSGGPTLLWSCPVRPEVATSLEKAISQQVTRSPLRK